MDLEEKTGRADTTHTPIRWVVVSSYYSVTEAHLARLKLEGAGIPVALDNENLVAANVLYAPATGGVKVIVPADRAREAAEILAPPKEEEAVRCPECDSEDIERRGVSWLFLLSCLLLLPLLALLFPRAWRCRTCGHSWR